MQNVVTHRCDSITSVLVPVADGLWMNRYILNTYIDAIIAPFPTTNATFVNIL